MSINNDDAIMGNPLEDPNLLDSSSSDNLPDFSKTTSGKRRAAKKTERRVLKRRQDKAMVNKFKCLKLGADIGQNIYKDLSDTAKRLKWLTSWNGNEFGYPKPLEQTLETSATTIQEDRGRIPYNLDKGDSPERDFWTGKWIPADVSLDTWIASKHLMALLIKPNIGIEEAMKFVTIRGMPRAFRKICEDLKRDPNITWNHVKLRLLDFEASRTSPTILARKELGKTYFPRTVEKDIYCYNCNIKGHYSTSCRNVGSGKGPVRSKGKGKGKGKDKGLGKG